MKSCHVCNQLTAFLANELSPAKHNEIINHLTTCSLCQQELQQQERINRLLNELPLEHPAPSFTDSVMAQLGNQAPQPLSEHKENRTWLQRSSLLHFTASATATFILFYYSSTFFSQLTTYDKTVHHYSQQATVQFNLWLGQITNILQ